jgi:sulfur carrier protein
MNHANPENTAAAAVESRSLSASEATPAFAECRPDSDAQGSSGEPSLTVNGESRPFVASESIAELLIRLGYQTRYLAVEWNREVVPRSAHGETVLSPGDQLEIVTLVGGG